MSKTITIQLGNTDDKLSQREWSKFVTRAHSIIWNFRDAVRVHFMGASSPQAPWQNVAWVLEVVDGHENRIGALQARLVALRHQYRQDSIAWTEGTTQFV